MLPSKVSWANWDKLYLDASLWEAPVRRVLSELGFSVLSVRAGFPGTSAVFRAECIAAKIAKRNTTDSRVRPERGGDGLSLIVKFFPPMVRSDFDAERCVYRALSPISPLPVPRLIAAGVMRDTIDWPYIVLVESPGTAVRDARAMLEACDLAEIAEQVGVHLRSLHGIERRRVPELDRSVVQWKAWAMSRLETASTELSRIVGPSGGPLIPPEVISDLRRFLASKGASVVESVKEEDLCLIHADVTEDHVLISSKAGPESPGWHVETIFDFGDAMVAPVYYEWIPIWFSLLRQENEAFANLLRHHSRTFPARPTTSRDTLDALFTFTFIHRFAAAIVKETIDRTGAEVSSFADLRELLWPNNLAYA